MRSPEDILVSLNLLHAEYSHVARKLIESSPGKGRSDELAGDMATGAEVVIRLFLMAAQKQLPPK